MAPGEAGRLHPMSDPSEAPRRVAVLGSTGSIGRSTLEVIRRLPERLSAFALAASSRIDALAAQTLEHQPRIVALADESRADEFRERVGGAWRGELWVGADAATRVAALSEVDVVLNGLVGAAGLRPSSAAVGAGKVVALANKESLVVAGSCLTREARSSGAVLLPVDSEHAAIFQLLQGQPQRAVRRLILTASGGPFRTRGLESFEAILPAEALRHPTWEMGPRITVDSATLLNKGFEVLEAHWLFGLAPDRIGVWIHPQSIVHGLVEWVDGSTTAQLSAPDMKLPIQAALCHPERVAAGIEPCDLAQIGRLDFEEPDPRRYPCLGLARRALEEGETAPSVLNAADEVLVHAFLERGLPFPQIGRMLARVLDERPNVASDELEDVLEADAWARRRTAALVSAAL